MDADTGVCANSLPHIHGDRLGVKPDVLDRGRALAQSVPTIVVHHDVDAVFDVEVEQV